MNPYCQCPYKDSEIEDQHCIAYGLEVDPEYFDYVQSVAQEINDDFSREEE